MMHIRFALISEGSSDRPLVGVIERLLLHELHVGTVTGTWANDTLATLSPGKQVDAQLPVVPIQETEAWLLLDESAIRRHAGNPNGRDDFGVPRGPKQIESKKDPKELLRQALVRAARPGRLRRKLMSDGREFSRIRRLLLEELDVEGPVTQLSAWQTLVTDISNWLAPQLAAARLAELESL